MHFTGNFDVERDMFVGGDLSGIGRLKVGGEIAVAGDNRVIGWRDTMAGSTYPGAPTVSCGCDAKDRFDVAQAVAEAKQDNDNAAVGLATDIAHIGLAQITFGDGIYYFENVRTIGATRLYIEGVVALYIDGDLAHIGDSQIRMAPGAVLDLYVNGNVGSIGHTEMAEGADPASFRLYVGGTDPVVVQVGNQIYNGAIYAPEAVVKYVGNTKIHGALTAKTLVSVGNLELGSARAKNPAPDSCNPPAKDPPVKDDPGTEPPVKDPDGPDQEDPPGPDKDPPVIR